MQTDLSTYLINSPLNTFLYTHYLLNTRLKPPLNTPLITPYPLNTTPPAEKCVELFPSQEVHPRHRLQESVSHDGRGNNTPYQYAPLRIFYTPYQHTLSTHLVNTPSLQESASYDGRGDNSRDLPSLLPPSNIPSPLPPLSHTHTRLTLVP